LIRKWLMHCVFPEIHRESVYVYACVCMYVCVYVCVCVLCVQQGRVGWEIYAACCRGKL